ncbi:MAG: thioesterase family protein [Pseudomonadota bacterium]
MRPEPPTRSAYRLFRPIATRWADNDVYGHVNNVQYYAFFDTAVNGYLVETGALDILQSQTIGLVVATNCDYFAPVMFPDALEAGLRTDRIGTSSVTYAVGIFLAGSDTAAAAGSFTHVYVDRTTRRPAPLAETLRSALTPLAQT